MSEDDEIKRFLGELALSCIGTGMENRAKTEDKNNMWWNIAENIGKDMKENPEKYYELGEWLYNNFKEYAEWSIIDLITIPIEKTS